MIFLASLGADFSASGVTVILSIFTLLAGVIGYLLVSARTSDSKVNADALLASQQISADKIQAAALIASQTADALVVANKQAEASRAQITAMLGKFQSLDSIPTKLDKLESLMTSMQISYGISSRTVPDVIMAEIKELREEFTTALAKSLNEISETNLRLEKNIDIRFAQHEREMRSNLDDHSRQCPFGANLNEHLQDIAKERRLVSDPNPPDPKRKTDTPP